MDRMEEMEEKSQPEKKKGKGFLSNLFQKSQKDISLEQDKEGAEEQELEEVSPVPVFDVPEPVAACHQKWLDLAAGDRPAVGEFLASDVAFSPDFEPLFTELGEEASRWLERTCTKEEEPAPVDASLVIKFSQNQVYAYGFLFPPYHGGREMGMESIQEAMKQKGIVYGIREGLAEQMAAQPEYLKLFVLAEGVPPVDGEDGWIEDVIPRTVGIPHVESDEKTVDYKNMNWLVHVKEEDVICKVYAPTEQQPGTSVLGKEVRGNKGKKPSLPSGMNTGLNKEGTALIVKTDGQIFYDHDKYRVSPMVVIDGDVDLSTGNLKIVGNLLIKGNVLDGFVVQATGDINVEGMVEGATVIAGGNIFVRMGMNGNSHGSMDASKDVKCRYLENAAVRASGSIFVESIVNSNVVSDNSIIVSSNRGIIIGGFLSAMDRIEAKVIGNKLHRTTVMMLGPTANFIKEKERITEEFGQMQADITEMQSKADELEKQADESAQSVLKGLKLKLSLSRMKESSLQKSLEQIAEKEERLAYCKIQAGTLYPIAQVTIGGITRVICEMAYGCTLVLDRGEIRFGSG